MGVFLDFWNKSKFADLSLDVENSDRLIRLLDSIVIMLEGGNEEDLKVVNQLLLSRLLTLEHSQIATHILTRVEQITANTS